MRPLAWKLLSQEEAIYETLRASLSKLAGVHGFAALAQRALALGRAESPKLQEVRINADGSLEGLPEVSAEVDIEPEVILISHLLDLLVLLIGEPLTLRLVKEAWPSISFLMLEQP